MDLSEKQLIESVFAGGGDMGARMRAFDWSTTDLGPVAHWPQSLRAGVRIVLAAGHPMLISWGPDYTMLYNDAYGVVVGTKHPGALGRSCREVLAEAWDFIGPRFDASFKEGQTISTLSHQLFTFHRKNYLEECYFAFSYSPIPDDEGRVGGVLTNALDMTDRVIEDRRRQVLRDLASRTAEARHEDEGRISAATRRSERSGSAWRPNSSDRGFMRIRSCWRRRAASIVIFRDVKRRFARSRTNCIARTWRLRDEVDRTSMFEEIVGSSDALRPVLSRIAKVAPTDSTVLIAGETGTGKELIARAVHKRSHRSGRAFVNVNCAALAPTLISSELFGHEKGAFTGAMQRRLGRFEQANGGTIFLDEVGELPHDTQVALLRVLQEREFERVGGSQTIQGLEHQQVPIQVPLKLAKHP